MANAGQKKIMITQEKYLQSVQIVKEYHKQVQNLIDSIKLTPIDEYIYNVDCSIRLHNIIKQCNEEYIENIDIKKMRNIRGCGRKTILEFIELRGY